MSQNLQHPALDDHAVREAYRLWAPIYDYSFGLVAGPGRRLAVQKLNEAEGRVLEIGVGTGLSLPRYKPSLEVTGIDLSPICWRKPRSGWKPQVSPQDPFGHGCRQARLCR